jgi:hypothetical protein
MALENITEFVVGVALCGHPRLVPEGAATEGRPYNDVSRVATSRKIAGGLNLLMETITSVVG